MSRAINVDATHDEVVAMAAKHDAAISAIESLQSQGTRVVFVNMDGAALVTKAFGSRVIKGPVVRTPWAAARFL
jgi:ABC-type branched-subunit amino acid transport system substrate-binding protein